MKIANKQIELISLAKKYLETTSLKGIDISASGFCWLLNVSVGPGYFILKSLYKNKKFIFKDIFSILKDFSSISILHNYKLLSKINLEENFDRLIVSWVKKSDFQENGSYNDRYFNVNSRSYPKSIWYLLSLDEEIPKKIDKNIIIFGKEDIKKKYSFIYLFKVFLLNLKLSKGSLVKTLHLSTRSSHLAKLVSKSILELARIKSFKSILMAYEAQPFQNRIFKSIKEFNSDIKLIGYLCSTLSLPTYSMYRHGSPDILLVHGDSQIFHLKKYLNWPENKIRLIPSLRYPKKDITKFSNSLVLPISLYCENILKQKFEFFLKSLEKKSLKPFTIKNHPLMSKSKKHKKFVGSLESVIKKYNDRFDNQAKRDIAIFFGGTSAILEALEAGLTTIHICTDSVLESYSETIWPAIKVNQFAENIFEYNLRSYGKCINFSVENNIFDKYCNLYNIVNK